MNQEVELATGTSVRTRAPCGGWPPGTTGTVVGQLSGARVIVRVASYHLTATERRADNLFVARVDDVEVKNATAR